MPIWLEQLLIAHVHMVPVNLLALLPIGHASVLSKHTPRRTRNQTPRVPSIERYSIRKAKGVNIPVVCSIISSIPVHTIRIRGETVLIWPALPVLVGTCDAFLPDLLAPHHVLAAQVGTVVFDPFCYGLTGCCFDLFRISIYVFHVDQKQKAWNGNTYTTVSDHHVSSHAITVIASVTARAVANTPDLLHLPWELVYNLLFAVDRRCLTPRARTREGWGGVVTATPTAGGGRHAAFEGVGAGALVCFGVAAGTGGGLVASGGRKDGGECE